MNYLLNGDKNEIHIYCVKIKKGLTNTIRLGTRGSKLALWQAYYTKDLLETKGVSTEIVIIRTKGDKIQHLSFDKIEGKGFFTKELEDALINQRIDLAVHSMKDLPTTMDKGLTIAGVSPRENPADWLIVNKRAFQAENTIGLKTRAIVGTSSARRKALLLDSRSDLQLQDIRGNVPTRLKKLANEDFDAIVLAAAGLNRLQIDLGAFEVVRLSPNEFVPAPAQGVIAFQCRESDDRTKALVKTIHNRDVAEKSAVERKILHMFDGGCHLPLGAYCRVDQMGNYLVWAAFAESASKPIKRASLSRKTTDGLAEAVVDILMKVK